MNDHEPRADDPLRAIAEALWNIGQGYTPADVATNGARVSWHPDNAYDVADEAIHMGHAARVLDILTATGWTSTPRPPVSGFVREVRGSCPMGCGERLFLGTGGFVTCSALNCPRPDAVSTLLDDAEIDHVVLFGRAGFTIRHPLRERLEDALMTCDLHTWCSELDGPLDTQGPVRMRQTSDGEWKVI